MRGPHRAPSQPPNPRSHPRAALPSATSCRPGPRATRARSRPRRGSSRTTCSASACVWPGSSRQSTVTSQSAGITFRFCEAVDHRRRDGHPEERLDELDSDRIDQTRGLEHLVRVLRRRTDRGLEERGHLGLEPRLRLELAEPLDQLRRLDERVVRDRRHRRVAASPANAQHERRAHLLGRRREVERLPGELDPVARALVDRVLGANGVRMLPAEPGEPEVDARPPRRRRR